MSTLKNDLAWLARCVAELKKAILTSLGLRTESVQRGETYTITNCARCGGLHIATFKPLTHPIVTTELTFTLWAPCPVNGEPILMGVLSKSEEHSVTVFSDPQPPTQIRH